MTLSKKIKNRIGLKYGRLTVVEFSHIAKTQGRNAYWKCVCDCGNETIVGSQHLGKGTNSCGCSARELSRTRVKQLHDKGKHLYFITCGEFTKIGRADDVELRLKQLQSACPHEMEINYVMENQGHLEKFYHNLYKDKLHRGEWYRL